jgi:hypothetical protein
MSNLNSATSEYESNSINDKQCIRICVTHDTPLTPKEFYDIELCLGEYGTEKSTHISRLNSFWHENRNVSYGCAGSYSVPELLYLKEDIYDYLELCAYRKKVIDTKIGFSSLTYSSMQIVNGLSLDASTIQSIKARVNINDFLVSKPLIFDSDLMLQYANCHLLQDLLDYTSIAIDLSIINQEHAEMFLRCKLLIPGGCELGRYPIDWSIKTLSALRQVGAEFLARYKKRIECYNAYQIRALGFLSERLGSYLLLMEFNRRFGDNVPDSIFGYMTTFTNVDNEDYIPNVA